MQPDISVIIPVYNSESFIESCLESIYAQSYTKFEIIVVNDGSTDGTLEVLKNQKPEITIINKRNGGVSSARNLGIQEACGKYIAFIDSDDRWHPEKLKIQLDVMENNLDLLACYTKVINAPFDDNVVWRKDLSARLIKKDIESIFSYPYLGTSTFFVRSKIVKQIGGFDETLKTAEDIDLYLKISNDGFIGEINDKLVHKAKVENSLGSLLSSYSDNLFVIERFVKDVNPLIDKPELLNKMKARIYLCWAEDLSWHGYTWGSFLKSISYLKYSNSSRNVFYIIKLFLASILRRKL
jgi:glycosyltransferase involved in cell wall biosynthesis